MTTFSDEEILLKILYKLFNNRCFVKGHMLEEHVISSVPKHERGRAKEVLERGVKLGLINIYGRTKHGIAYQLNIQRLEEIKTLINKYRVQSL